MIGASVNEPEKLAIWAWRISNFENTSCTVSSMVTYFRLSEVGMRNGVSKHVCLSLLLQVGAGTSII